MTENFEFITRRRISGTGTLTLPTELSWRWFYLYLNVIRPPSIDYANFESLPSRGFYARICAMRDKYVLSYKEMRFRSEVIQIPRREGDDWQINPLICNFSAINFKLNLILAILGAPPPVPSEEIKWLPVEVMPDRYQIACRDDTAIEIELYGIKIRKDCPEAGEGGAPPPDVPVPPPPSFPPGTPIEDISPPEPDFPEDTVPFPDDEEEPSGELPVGDECQQVRVTGTVIQTSNNGQDITTFPFNVVLWGTVQADRLIDGSPSTSTTDYSYDALCRGRADNGGQCQENDFWQPVVTPAGNFIDPGSFQVINVEYTPL